MNNTDEITVYLLRALADRLEKGEVTVVRVTSQVSPHPLANTDPYETTGPVNRLEVEVAKAIPKKDC